MRNFEEMKYIKVVSCVKSMNDSSGPAKDVQKNTSDFNNVILD